MEAGARERAVAGRIPLHCGGLQALRREPRYFLLRAPTTSHLGRQMSARTHLVQLSCLCCVHIISCRCAGDVTWCLHMAIGRDPMFLRADSRAGGTVAAQGPLPHWSKDDPCQRSDDALPTSILSHHTHKLVWGGPTDVCPLELHVE